jgi:hypothetical protein
MKQMPTEPQQRGEQVARMKDRHQRVVVPFPATGWTENSLQITRGDRKAQPTTPLDARWAHLAQYRIDLPPEQQQRATEHGEEISHQ